MSTTRGPWFSAPSRDRGLGKPDRQAPTLTQGGIIVRPIRDLVPLLRNMMAAIGIHLERHGAHPENGAPPLRRPVPDPKPVRSVQQGRDKSYVAAQDAESSTVDVDESHQCSGSFAVRQQRTPAPLANRIHARDHKLLIGNSVNPVCLAELGSA